MSYNTNNLKYIKNADLKVILDDAFSQTSEGEGFEYIVGKVFGGELKVVFEPDSGCFDSNCFDGVDGFGFCSVVEVNHD